MITTSDISWIKNIYMPNKVNTRIKNNDLNENWLTRMSWKISWYKCIVFQMLWNCTSLSQTNHYQNFIAILILLVVFVLIKLFLSYIILHISIMIVKRQEFLGFIIFKEISYKRIDYSSNKGDRQAIKTSSCTCCMKTCEGDLVPF